jgi:hypothetical protein
MGRGQHESGPQEGAVSTLILQRVIRGVYSSLLRTSKGQHTHHTDDFNSKPQGRSTWGRKDILKGLKLARIWGRKGLQFQDEVGFDGIVVSRSTLKVGDRFRF